MISRPVRLSVRFRNYEIARLARDPKGGVILLELQEMKRAGIGINATNAFKCGQLPESLREEHGFSKSLTGIPGWLADSLPDAWGRRVLEEYLAAQLAGSQQAEEEARTLSSDFLMILSFVGADSSTGVEFVPDAEHSSAIGPLDLIKAAREARAVESAVRISTGDFSQLRHGWSAGGARAKTHVGLGPSGEWVAGAGVADLCRRGFTPWLLKLGNDSEFDKTGNQAGRIEYAYHRMATACGVEMSECRLIEDSSGIGHFVTRRFDRTATGVIPFRSLAGLLNTDKREKISYERQWRVRREICRSDAGADAFFRRVIFNIAACVRDDHARNFGFLLENDGWRQSPAFDLTFCDAKEHSATIDGKAANFTRSGLVAYGKKIGVRDADHHLDAVVAECARWPEYAKAGGVSLEMSADVSKHIEAVLARLR